MFSLITNAQVLQPSISSNKIFGEPYKDGLGELTSYYAQFPNCIELILKHQSIRSAVEAYYQVLVNHKELKEIETLPIEEKIRIWKMTEGASERLKASRAIYLMEKVNENKN